jgi:hypothetical protein
MIPRALSNESDSSGDDASNPFDEPSICTKETVSDRDGEEQTSQRMESDDLIGDDESESDNSSRDEASPRRGILKVTRNGSDSDGEGSKSRRSEGCNDGKQVKFSAVADDGDDFPAKTKKNGIQKERQRSQRIKKVEESDDCREPDSDEDEDEDDDDVSNLCVGSLDVKYMRLSYFMVPGDAIGEDNQDFNSFVTKPGKILVALCGKLKPNAVIGENHWALPDANSLFEVKASSLKKKFHAIRDHPHGSNAALGHNSTNTTQNTALNASAGVGDHKKDVDSEEAHTQQYSYDPRADRKKKTDKGDALPEDTISYAYLSTEQFRSNAVRRLDLGVPFTYAIRHLPNERSVPMLQVYIILL